MIDHLTPHFSRKILLLSLIFVLSNLGIYGLRSVIGVPELSSPVAPRLISAMQTDIEVKSSYDDAYKPAEAEQYLYSGSQVKTGDKEFAELILERNAIRLDENTEIRLLKNNSPGTGVYMANEPRLEVELMAGSIWVNAFDLIAVRSGQSVSHLHHSVGILSYSNPLNRVMVVTGDVDLSLLSEAGEKLAEFVVPLDNQVTFLDTQLTETYTALKPSKLRKELKMSPISEAILSDPWVTRNANDFSAGKALYSQGLISSELAYKIKTGSQQIFAYLAFTPEAKRQMTLQRAQTMLGFLLGKIQDDNDRERAKEIIADFERLVALKNGDPKLQELIVETLFAIEKASPGSPAYQLRETLMQRVAKNEGIYVYRIYLTDLRKALYEANIKEAEQVADRWLEVWPGSVSAQNQQEFDRQSQILNHTILSFADRVTLPVLSVFDEAGTRKISQSQDVEEARFEVISDRLQITASLVARYRYILAKNYLKNSYLGLDIEHLSTALASTQIFLETGKLLAQRIEYAEAVLRGAARPIDETGFQTYFATLRRDEALSADLRKFFELDEASASEAPVVIAPTAAQVAARFLDARINVNYADISLVPASGFYYQVKNARLMDRGPDGSLLSFDAEYDYVSNSVARVTADGKAYQGSFRLTDIVTALKSGGNLESRIPTPKTGAGIESLITDTERIDALQGQAIAQDIARQLAFNQLQAVNVIIPEPKFDIDILDSLNLNSFFIKTALILRTEEKPAVVISFNYNSAAAQADDVRTDEGGLLLKSVAISDLASEVLKKIAEIERQLEQAASLPKLPGSSDTK